MAVRTHIVSLLFPHFVTCSKVFYISELTLGITVNNCFPLTTLVFISSLIICLFFFFNNSSLGKSKARGSRQSIINPDWNFERMGIGGLDKEFSDIFRRAFASRVFPPDIVEQMGEYRIFSPSFTLKQKL